MDFNTWYNENKDSSEMIEGYRNYKDECKQTGDTPLSKKEWAKEQFEIQEVGFQGSLLP